MSLTCCERGNVLTYLRWGPGSRTLAHDENKAPCRVWEPGKEIMAAPIRGSLHLSVCYDHGQVRSTPVPGPESSILSNDVERTGISTRHRCDWWQPIILCPMAPVIDFEMFDICFGRGGLKHGFDKLLSM